ncbi:hypothetical protein O181_064768 [Austropuccinia psidii MF-1]|uniref:Uncharacterized protein n=1 Tax=Austropuccinia psidii MF-1 TaxID=1389203 RepID=A0A9Q3I1Y3_9BASI|nr:hypothetical protein [Austropuccinia psidii MF-1]
MPVQHSPPKRQTKSQATAQAVLAPTPRALLDGIPAVPQLRAQLERGPHMEGRKRDKKINEDTEDEEENSVEEERSDGTEGVPAPVRAFQGTGGPTVAQSKQPVSHQSEPSFIGHHAENDSNHGQSLRSFIFGIIKTTSLQESIYEGTRIL